jgi:hypothetical protein
MTKGRDVCRWILRWGGALLLAPLLAGAATPPSDVELGFYGGTRDDVLALCKRVGLVPGVGPLLAGVDPDAYARIEPKLAAVLTDAGIVVVDSAPYYKAYDRFSHAVGGIFEPMTGALRKDMYTSVYQNASREFIAQSSIDCIGMLRAVEVQTVVEGSTTTWDGVREYVDGEQRGALSRFWADKQGNGHISAVSLLVQFMNREGKVVFARRGGVQLAGYFARDQAGAGIVSVPRDQLLRDDARIDRALRSIAVPLKHTGAEIFAGQANPTLNLAQINPTDLPPPPPGVHRDRGPGLRVPRDQVVGPIHRVLFPPLYPGKFAPPTEVAARMRDKIRTELVALGWEVVDAPGLAEAYGAAVQRAGGLWDPFTGRLDETKGPAAIRAAIEAQHIEPAVDGVLWARLDRVVAIQQMSDATWDGTSQNAMTLGPVIKGASFFGGSSNAQAGESTVNAVSLAVMLQDANGKPLYEQRGGIELVQQLSLRRERRGTEINFRQDFADRAPSELFKDGPRLERAIDLALRELVLSADEIAAQAKPAVPVKR